eukprot:CAMPEP_0197655156 /NCGR_PEP_ID=MMETSP1338-20131121/39286_1 /TAXON_ID=43686 ORGANISM="Pelagodinium beii, Strain RCC1491" /NCGR_SAMPLE_ID=MMETSP1338 /ASSEMBLY_ACC=CAM_ASM_000754 /LENGTH=124 /DNA_ID=CAMNT_0043230749 /DNA_START=55 /DNA_END=429 /DNA_ORIENTATION=+
MLVRISVLLLPVFLAASHQCDADPTREAGVAADTRDDECLFLVQSSIHQRTSNMLANEHQSEGTAAGNQSEGEVMQQAKIDATSRKISSAFLKDVVAFAAQGEVVDRRAARLAAHRAGRIHHSK